MDICLLIRQRLEELGLRQKDLAAVANVTESYISQLLTRKKMPPAPGNTDIFERMETYLMLPSDQLSTLAGVQRREELLKELRDPATPLFGEIRKLIQRRIGKRKPAPSGGRTQWPQL